MKTIATILTILLIASSAFASSNPNPIALPLQHYLEDLGQFKGADVRTTYNKNTNEYELTYWDANGVATPTDGDLVTIVADYDQYLIDQADEKLDSKNKTKTKLGMSDKQLEELKQALEITP